MKSPILLAVTCIATFLLACVLGIHCIIPVVAVVIASTKIDSFVPALA